jgi:chromate transporter
MQEQARQASNPSEMTPDGVMTHVPIRELIWYYLRLGALGFGGPVALVGLMERELVGQRKWVTKEEMRESIFSGLPPVTAIFYGVSPAVLALILHSCSRLAKLGIGDWFTALIALLSLVVLFRWNISNPILVAATALIGLMAFPLLQPTWVFVK